MEGAVVSRTITEKVAIFVTPSASTTRAVTRFVPMEKMEPEGGEAVTGMTGWQVLVPARLKVTIAPAGLVSSATMFVASKIVGSGGGHFTSQKSALAEML